MIVTIVINGSKYDVDEEVADTMERMDKRISHLDRKIEMVEEIIRKNLKAKNETIH